MKKGNLQLRTWVEIDTKALQANLGELRRILGKRIKILAVVKSNAYGHGLVGTAKALKRVMPSIWFGVDSFVEGLRLRKEGVKNPILVLGSTLPALFQEAARQGIILTISTFEALDGLSRLKTRPAMHIKVDTGMHRQGFLPEDVPRVIKLLKRFKILPAGIYTHFAAKDWGYPAYTWLQLAQFKKALKIFERDGFKNTLRHAAASDATLLFPETHFDMVRVGMGLYGYWPSWVAKVKHPARVSLRPVLAWKTVVGEVKAIPKGSYVGYDLTEQVPKDTKIAVLPIGYWHGYDRGLSSVGETLVSGRRAKILGRVSMDMLSIDITDIPGVKVGDTAVLIGRQGKEAIWADELSLKIGTSQYEFLTRINPLIERIYK